MGWPGSAPLTVICSTPGRTSHGAGLVPRRSDPKPASPSPDRPGVWQPAPAAASATTATAPTARAIRDLPLILPPPPRWWGRPSRSTTGPTRRSAQALDDGGVGHAAALTHRLQAVAAPGALELVEQRGEQLVARAPERVAEGDGAAVHVGLRQVAAGPELPGQHDGGERLVDLEQVDVVDR